MSGPTRQRSFRERLHGIGIPWQGKKSKSYHSKEGQALAEDDAKAAFQDSRSCDPIPSCEEVSRPDGSPPKDESKQQSLPEPENTYDKAAQHKEIAHFEKKLLSRSFTQPKGTEEYHVKASDTLERIAARFDTTPSELAKLNRLTARMIFPGQMLFVPEKKFLSSFDASATSDGSSDDTRSNGLDSNDHYSDDQPSLQKNGKLAAASGDALPRRKTSVTDALRIPYRRHSDRMQRFLKVKARHFTDGQGVVAGVLIITPNAVMFDPNVSDPLVIEHGIESYGVIAPLDMVMRTAIYFDIAHMKVKNAPETQITVPKPDIYYGKMSSSNSQYEEKKVENTKEPAQTLNSETPKALNNEPVGQPQAQAEGNGQEAGTKALEQAAATDAIVETADPQMEAKEPDKPSSEEAKPEKPSEDATRKSDSEADQDVLSRDGSLDKEVSDAFANGAKRTFSGDSSVGSPTPPPLPQHSAGDEGTTGKQAPESRRERMLKRLSYPMESITSYTQSSISRILSSSPKSFVDFSSGLFVRSSEEDKTKDGAPIPTVAEESEEARGDEQKQPSGSVEEQTEDKLKENGQKTDKEVPTNSAAVQPSEEKLPTVVGYKNLVEEKPELFAVLDKLLKQHAAEEQEGPPLYLCLRMGLLKEKKLQSTPILSYGKKKAKSEYWFSIPHNRVEDLYNFLQQWFPQLYGDVDDIDPDTLGFIPIDDSAEDEDKPEEQEQEEEEKKEEQPEDDVQKRSTPRSFLKLVEEHFGFRSISPTDWEVLSLNETEKFSFEDLELPFPDLLAPSEIMEEEHIKEIHNMLPARAVGYPWTQFFSTSQHGFNLKTLYRKMEHHETPILLLIEDTEGSIFGAVISTILKPSDHFYGNGESFLFTFYPEFKIFKWTGDNEYFAKGDADSIVVGSGSGQFGIWVDGDLNHGRSQKCSTFDNDILCKNEDFVIKTMEVWGFV